MSYSVIGVLLAEKEINTVKMMTVHIDEWRERWILFVRKKIVYSKESSDLVEVIYNMKIT